jgi:hypothetical protein
MFDDAAFSKTRIYHWAIKHCYDIDAFIESTAKFIQRFQNSQLVHLQRAAHPYEASGINHWALQLQEAISDLEVLQTEVKAFCEQVREMVC